MNSSASIFFATKFWLASLVVLAFLLSVTIGCGSDETSSTTTVSPTAVPAAKAAPVSKAPQGPAYGGNLRLGVNLGMKTLDALHPSGEYREQYAFFMLYNSLVEADEDFVPNPSLAESWEISEDGKAVTLYLKRGVKFHDGTSFDAQTVKWFLDNIVLDDFGARIKANFKPFIDRVDVVDQFTVTVHTVKPWRPLLGHATLAWFRFPSPTAYLGYNSQRDGKLWLGPADPYGRNPVGTGPFMLGDWVPDSHLTLIKNPDYWEDGKPYLDKVTFENIPQKSSQLAAIRTGAAELVDDVFGPDIPVLEGSDNVKVIPYVTKRWWSVVLDNTAEPFNNKSLRQAIAYALDREQIVDVHFEGQGGPAYMAGVGWYDDPDWRIYEHSTEKAKEKLAEAGYSGGVTLPFWCEQSETEIRLCEIEQAMLQEVGIELEFQPVPPSDYWAEVAKGNVDFGRMAYYPRPDPDWVLRSILHSKGFYTGVAGYSNPEVDKLIDDAVGVFDPAIAGPMYIQAQKIVFEDAPYISLYNEKVFVALNKKVQNFVWIPDTLLRLRELWIEK